MAEFGNKKCRTWMSADSGDYKGNDWILCLRETSKRVGAASWMFAHHVVSVPKSERKKLNDGYAAQVLQVGSLRDYEQPPFSLRDKRIQRAIKAAYRETELDGPKPSIRFIKSIDQHFNE
jgi:hypothetical protein